MPGQVGDTTGTAEFLVPSDRRHLSAPLAARSKDADA
jgi:hypothetical protein